MGIPLRFGIPMREGEMGLHAIGNGEGIETVVVSGYVFTCDKGY